MKAQEGRKEAIKKLYNSYLLVNEAINTKMPYGENFTVHNDEDEQFVSKIDSVKAAIEDMLNDLYIAFKVEEITSSEFSSNQEFMQKIKEIAES
jgi:hypothetical protein